MLKMANQGMSDFCVAFTVILCSLKSFAWRVMKLMYTALFQMALPSILPQFETHTSSDINVSWNLSTKSIVVKTTQKSDRSWSATFGVIIYCCDPEEIFAQHE